MLSRIKYRIHMKTITINVSEPVYREFQQFAKSADRPASELIREAMEDYRQRRMRGRTSLRDLRPVSLGAVKRELRPGDDLLEEMLNAQGC